MKSGSSALGSRNGLRILRSLIGIGVLATVVAGASQAGPFAPAVIFDEQFSYADGSLTSVSGGNWTTHSGTTGQIQVSGGKITLSDSQSEDVNRSTGSTLTTGKIFAALDFSVAANPNASGTDYEYFAHFGNGTSDFTARMDIQRAQSSGDFTVGIAGNSSTAEATWGADLAFGTTYQAVIEYDRDTGLARLWIDPSSLDSPSIASTAPDSNDVEGFYFRQSGSSMNETITVENLTVATDFPARCSHTEALTTGQWKQMSLPCDPGTANTVNDIVADDLDGTYGTDWIMYRRDETTTSYVALTLGDELIAGESYWIRTNVSSPSQSVNVGADGDRRFGNVAQADIDLTGVAAPAPAGCDLSAGQCNMVGHPRNFDVCWSDVLVDTGTGPLKTLTEVDPGGACQGGGGTCIMSRIAHKWNGSAYTAFDGVTAGMQGALEPWDGFWVSANQPGIKLRIPDTPTESACNFTPPPVRGRAESGWFIRLIAESGTLRDASNVFGRLPDSVRGYDSHDLPELDPFGDTYLTIVFPQDKWGERSGVYTSDYRGFDSTRRGEIWHFEVRASNLDGPVRLSWESSDSDKRFRNATLIDLESGRPVAITPDGYTFKMAGESHRFRWIQNR